MRKVLAAALLLVGCAGPRHEITVAAAASLQDALREVARGYGGPVAFDFAGSNVLARQIRAGAPVDVFLSADTRTMDSVRDLVQAPRPLLSNTLVVVGQRPLRSLQDLAALPRVALADPNAVPAGVYARQALQAAGVWERVAPRVVPCESVRAALAAVESGAVDAAIVYATDARIAKRSRVVLTIENGPPIVYPIAIVRDSAEARKFVEYCFSEEGMKVFRRYGFAPHPAFGHPLPASRGEGR